MKRPTCSLGHEMTFVAQINLSDCPDTSVRWHGLLSFHYCNECSFEGNMAFGWNDNDTHNYDVGAFMDLTVTSDGLGNVAKTSVTNRQVSLESVQEVQDWEDMPDDLSKIIPDEVFDFVPPDYDPYSLIPSDNLWPSVKHVQGTKIGGHPTWVQSAEWAPYSGGGRMKFVAQLDGLIGEELTWPGGAVYLFAERNKNGTFECEMLLQTT